MSSGNKRKPIALECHEPISLTLGENKLTFLKSQWTLDTSDIQIAAEEINDLVHENEKYIRAFDSFNEEVKTLKESLHSTSILKRTVLDMVMEERQKNMLLEKQLAMYKDKLKESYSIILELKRAQKE